MADRTTREQLEIHLRYQGPDVDDGTMSVEDIVPVLQGFSSAYGKLANRFDPNLTHRIRISAVRRGSADIVLEVWNFARDNANALTGLSILGGTAIAAVRLIVGVMRLKKHVKREPFVDRINASNSIVIANSQNVTIEVPLEVYELFRSKQLDSDLERIVSPLSEGRIDAAELDATSSDGEFVSETIIASERRFFATDQGNATTKTEETWVVGRLNSLTKSTNSGFVYLADGSRVFYKYVGPDPARLHRIFANDGPVRMRATASLDENLRPVQLDIESLEPMQGYFPFEPPAGSQDDSFS